MTALSVAAAKQIGDLRDHYEKKGRPEATSRLLEVLQRALHRVDANPDRDLHAPRPYPELAAEERSWIKEGDYWFSYIEISGGHVIVSIYYAKSDIPRRL